MHMIEHIKLLTQVSLSTYVGMLPYMKYWMRKGIFILNEDKCYNPPLYINMIIDVSSKTIVVIVSIGNII